MKYRTIWFVTLLALAATGCETEDRPPQPGYVSTIHDRVASVAPSVTGTAPAVMAANSPGSPSVTGTAREALAVNSPGYGDHSYFVEFRSRYALTYGHTYVVFGSLNEAGQAVNPEVAGLAPASKSQIPYFLGHFIPVPSETGWSDGDLEEKYRSASWRVMLNQAEYSEVVAYIRKLQASSPVWEATGYNCNSFAGDIARSMGYKVPSRYLRPQQFITELREMNTGPRVAVAANNVSSIH
jgi:hypothetical protein